jgi:D-alanine-D-alanine ligase
MMSENAPRKWIPKHTKVAVLMGGWSAERKVSLASGEACAEAIKRLGYETYMVDVNRETIQRILADLQPQIAFNALHGKWGEDGCASALLETMQIPYTHSGVLASSVAMHKEKSKVLFRAAGVPVADSKLVDLEVAASTHPMALPYVLKPVSEGSSVGVHIVDQTSNGPKSIILQHKEIYGDQVMVEKFIPGRELTCAVMGDVALGVMDIVPQIGFYDYEAKYAAGGSEHIYPADVPQEIYRKCQRMAIQAHQALGCRGISRSDFRYDDTHGGSGEVILLEVNTQPGMTGTSLVPELAKHAGHPFDELINWMLQDASINR